MLPACVSRTATGAVDGVAAVVVAVIDGRSVGAAAVAGGVTSVAVGIFVATRSRTD